MSHALPAAPTTLAPEGDAAPTDAVTYTIKVLDHATADDGREVRRVLFRRMAHGETLEIRAETDAPNLLAKLPDLLDAAFDVDRSVWAGERAEARPAPAEPARRADEARLLRWLALGGPAESREEEAAPAKAPRVLRLIGMAYRADRASRYRAAPRLSPAVPAARALAR